jgi:hypothetical protein
VARRANDTRIWYTGKHGGYRCFELLPRGVAAPMSLLALFISLPTQGGTDRVRVWRALKGLGCGTLRDGVYLLPDAPRAAAEQRIDA